MDIARSSKRLVSVKDTEFLLNFTNISPLIKAGFCSLPGIDRYISVSNIK